jgi:hypothetical protein
MNDFEQWQETIEAQLIIEQSGCDLIYLEQVWNAAKINTLNGISAMIASGRIIVKP